MNTSELAAQVATDSGLSKAAARTIVDSIWARIVEAAMEGEEVHLTGFGKFKVKPGSARKGRNPRTGEIMEIAPYHKLAFIPAQALRDKVNGDPSPQG